MRSLLVFTLACIATAPRLWADAVPYTNYGVVPPFVQLTATTSGSITGYLYGSNAGGTDYVRLFDVTSGYQSAFLLNNQTTTPGTSVNFGTVMAGDTLVFQLVNSDVETTKNFTEPYHVAPFDPNAQVNGYILGSDPAYSFDGINHAYVTSFTGSETLGIPQGVYLGMEDLPLANADLDYNDVEFIFTNTSAVSATPEPGSFLLLGTGAIGVAAGLRRRRRPRLG